MEVNKNSSYFQGDRPEMIRFVPDSSLKILDIGCGQGNFAQLLMRQDRDVWGVEPVVEAANIAKLKLNNILIGGIEDVINEIPTNYFDIIIFNDVLEHLYNPWNVLKLLKDKLNNDGKIIASIPNIRYITNLYDLIVKKDWEYKDFGILDSTHIRFFTKKTMLKLFEEQGYYINEITGIVKTASIKGVLLALLLNIVSLGTQKDVFHKQFVITAKKNI